MNGDSSKISGKPGTAETTPERRVLTKLFDHWSSHPQSLADQRKCWFWLGLVPIIFAAAFVALLLTVSSGWRLLVSHPTVFFWIVGGAAALSLGLVFSFAMLHLVARSRLASKTNDPDSLPFPTALVVLFSFFWVIPVTLSFVQAQWGVRLVPRQMLFVLNALCFVPFVLLLVWVRFAGDDSVEKEKDKVRRPFWFVLGTLLLGLAGLSLVVDLQVWVRNLKLPPSVSGLSTLALRAAALVALLPLSMVCYAVWALFRRSMTEEEKAGRKTKATRSIWRRLMDFLRGLFGGKAPDDSSKAPETEVPKWLSQLCAQLPKGVRIATADPPRPDLLPLPGTPVSDISKSADANPLWMLMGGSEDQRPTELQVQFFNRFRTTMDEARLARFKGNETSTDIILAGDEGSGRTEVLLAAAMYAAFARRQRVLYLVSDSGQAVTLCAKAERRFKAIFLDCFLRAEVLDGAKAENWVAQIKARDSKNGAATANPADAADRTPPNILFSTPRDVERIFFEGRGVDADTSSIDPLRDMIRLFEVVLVDDFMELDVVERAHVPFLLHKLRMILVSGNIQPQFVVVMPRLRGNSGMNAAAKRLFGFEFNRAVGEGNGITLLPRPCKPAWSLPLVADDGQDLGKTGEDLVRICLGLTTDSNAPLRVVLYRKGLHLDQCQSLKARIAPDERTRMNLQVVSRIDEIERKGGADAVFYLTALAGRANMALRLSVGDEKTVYLSLSSESEAIFGEAGDPGIIPALPDSRAAALRIHHLRSLLRFVVPGQPVDVSAWERFGVFLSDHLRVADIQKDSVLHEKWRQDEWDELAYGNCPLWPYVAFESKWSVKSNAGKRTDFNVLPSTDEDVVQLGDDPMIGLVRPRIKLNGKADGSGIGAGSLAKWLDGQGVERGCIDLAHAEALVLGRSALGDTYASSSGPATTVFTVKEFAARKTGDVSCAFRLVTQEWNGDGMDFDTPIRSLSWTVEPMSVPAVGSPDPGRAFAFFHLPDCRNQQRVVSGVVTGRVNRIGQDVPEMSDKKVRTYSYPAYFSGLLLGPRKFDDDGASPQIQRAIIGPWDTENGSFSVVLTHLLTGVLIRIVPDLPFYAAVPVFHQRGNDSAVAAAVAWIVQPVNSGQTVDEFVSDLLLGHEGQSIVQQALRAARSILESRPDSKARLRWLRSFSRSAFTFDIEKPDRLEAFEKDLAWSLEVLDVIDKRISGVLAEIEEFRNPIPKIACDHSWMSQARNFSFEGLQPDSAWTGRTQFPEPPALGRPDVSLCWHYGGREFTLDVGFANKDDAQRYKNFFACSFPARVWGDCYTEYGFNDPYREFMGELSGKLRQMAEEAFPSATKAQLAEFLLSFVQEGLPYSKDPADKRSDWPRHPSETLLRLEGGDCEDSSILYAELLRRCGIGNAILSIPRHAAVGVDVVLERTSSNKEPVVFPWLGHKYVYGETANNKFVTPLGDETELIPAAELVQADIIPTPMLAEDGNTFVRILNVIGMGPDSMEITLVAPQGTTDQLAVVIFARPHKDVFGAPDSNRYPCVGGVGLPPLPPRKVVSATVKFESPDFSFRWFDIFVCEPKGVVRGHFVGVPSGTLGEHGGYEKRISCDAYRDHALFRAKGRGNVKQCRGKVHLRIFFVDDAESSWDDSTRDAYRDVVADVARTLEREGSREAGVTVSWSAENRRMDGSFSIGCDAHDEIPALLGVSGMAGVTKLQNKFRESRECDEAPMVFVWNKDFRSSAKQTRTGTSRKQAEWVTIALDADIFTNRDAIMQTLLHELLHVFGAEDFYYPPAVKTAAKKWLPGSVMNDGRSIDDLTRVLIGWDGTLSRTAASFLDDTRTVTAQEIDEACEAEWRKKWHQPS